MAWYGTARVREGVAHSTPLYHTHQVLCTASASQIPQITGSKAIKQSGRRKQSGFSLINKGNVEGGGEVLSLCAVALRQGSFGPEPAKTPRGSAHLDAHPGPRDWWHGGFEGASCC